MSAVELQLGPGRHGLVGRNGSGKSTLLRLLSRQLDPTSGWVNAPERVTYVAQTVLLQTGDTLADLLGIRVEAEQQVRQDGTVRLALADTVVPAGRQILSLRDVVLRSGRRVSFDLTGPERMALVGCNGSGKTTPLGAIVAGAAPAAGSVELHVPARLVPQRLDLLPDDLAVVEAVRTTAAEKTDNEIRAFLARMLLRGSKVGQLVGSSADPDV